MSPVIILGLVLMWAVVLVPMWLRRHDEAEESRSADRFSNAMHTLSRPRERTADGRYVVMPHRARGVDVHVSGAAAPDPRPVSDEPATGAGSWRSRARRLAPLVGLPVRLLRALPALRPAGGARRSLSAAARRRRTLTGLLVLAVVTLVLAVTVGGWELWLVQVVADGCLVAFVRHLRRRAREAAIVSRQRRRVTVAPTRRVVAAADSSTAREPLAVTVAAPMPVWQRYAATAQAAAMAAEPAVTEPVAAVVGDTVVGDTVVGDAAPVDVVIGDAAVDGQTRDAGAPAAGAPADGSAPVAGAVASGEWWAPVPVPPPTYTMKPAAPARRRRRSPLAEPVDPAELGAPAAAHRAEPTVTGENGVPDAPVMPPKARPKRSAKPATKPAAASRKRSGARPEFDDDLAELDAILEHRRAVND